MLKARIMHRFTPDDYDRMIDTGILTENDHVELIRGEIVEKMPIGAPHAACVKRLNKRLNELVGDDALVGVQDPIRLEDSEPEPDLVLLRPRTDFYESENPVADDVLLLIEVADSTLEYDRTVKGPLYAENGIREYWIVNLADGCVEIHRDPRSSEGYRDTCVVQPGDRVELTGMPGLIVRISDVIGQGNEPT